jgi:outer membrane receptor protein involved in Fe transport
MKTRGVVYGSMLVAGLVIAMPVRAQNVAASIQGRITDSSGQAIQGAHVTVRNTGTGDTRELVTEADGRYHAPLLPPGEYEVKVAVTGFQTVEHRGIRLTVGQDAAVDVALQIGKMSEEVVVAGDVSRVNLTSGAVSGLVGEKEIRDLPLNGRSFQQLALLQPGVQAALAAGNDVIGGRAPKISINGARPEQNNFLLDGTDINNVYNKTPGSAGGVLLGVEAVLEFQVLTNAYSAEFGRSSGGVINAVTRSGANDYHGSAFEFHRNSALDARNFFDPPSRGKPDFTRNQFGAVLGGPIKKDRTFFFAAYEGLVERLGVTGVTAVPDDDARRGILPGGRTVTLHPAIPAYLDLLFPHANGRSLGGGAAEYLFTGNQPTDEHFFQARLDHRLSARDTMFVRYTYDRGDVDRIAPDKPPINIQPERTRNTYVTLEQQHTFSPSLLNLVRVGLNRSVSLADNQRTVNIPAAMSWIPGDPFGYLTIRGMVTEMAGDFRLPRDDRLNNWQLGDTLVWTRGRHSARAGVQAQYLQFDQHTTSQVGGIVNFANLESFLQGRPLSVDFAVPGKIDPDRRYRQWLFAAFLQDDVRLGSRLSANVGLRYEFVTTPTEADGKISNLRNVSDPELTVGGPWHKNPSLKNFAPRLGLAWDPFGSGQTSVRAGFGLFYDEILPKYYFFSGSLNPPFTTRTSIPNPPFPNVVANFNANARIAAQLQTVNYDLQTPYIVQFNASVQRALPGDWDVMVGYVGSRGKNLLRLGDANLARETMVNGVKVYLPGGRRNPNFTGIWQRVTDAESFYNSLQVAVQKRFTHGWRAQLSYTFSRSVDDSSGINSQDFSNVVQYGMDWYDPLRDRGLSAFHATHNLTFNGTWDLPFARSSRGLAAGLLKGWQLNNITTVRSGHPFTVQLGFNRSANLNTTSFSMHDRPDLKPGCSNNPILGGPDRYWDVNCFQLQAANTRGNLGRDTLIGPGLVSVDLSLVKTFELGRSRTLQFRAECFNLPNHPNFAVPSGRTAFTGVNPDGSPIVAPTWGRITSTVTTSRQIQLGLKLAF